MPSWIMASIIWGMLMAAGLIGVVADDDDARPQFWAILWGYALGTVFGPAVAAFMYEFGFQDTAEWSAGDRLVSVAAPAIVSSISTLAILILAGVAMLVWNMVRQLRPAPKIDE